MCIKEELVWGMDKRFKSISIILRKAVIILRNLINCLFIFPLAQLLYQQCLLFMLVFTVYVSVYCLC